MPQDRNVPVPYSTIRQAITASATGDTIKIAAGTYDITAGGAPATFAYAALPDITCISGFTTVTSLIYDGAGNSGDASVTTISGNPRLYVANQDGTPPVSLTFTDLDFLYTNPYSNYILQTGNFGVPVANTPTKTITLDNLSFRGVHPGNWLDCDGTPSGAFGNYAAVIGIQNFSLNNSTVSLTGQGTFTGTQAISGGSSFLMLQGGQGGAISITNNTFDESGYRNALSIYDSTNVTISGNTFQRGTAGTRFVRTDSSGTPKSNKIKNSTLVSVTSNNFYNGSFLALESGSGTLSGNMFDGTTTETASSGAIGVYLEGSPAPAYTYTNNTFRYVSPFVNATSSIQTVTTNGTSDNKFTNPRTALDVNIQQFVTGTSNGELLTAQSGGTVGAPRRDFLSGGLGLDTMDGGTGTGTENSDFFLFNTQPNTSTNWDTIINWTASSGTGGASAYRDQLVLDRKIYKDLTVLTSAGTYSLNGIGGMRANEGAPNGSGQNQVVANTNGTFANSYERIALATGGTDPGTLYYDQDGSGGAFSPIRFARIATGSSATTGPWITSLQQLGQILVI